jgi:hypothetical protein
VPHRITCHCVGQSRTDRVCSSSTRRSHTVSVGEHFADTCPAEHLRRPASRVRADLARMRVLSTVPELDGVSWLSGDRLSSLVA